jgi:tetratricopeptide (TPR) repeat protein
MSQFGPTITTAYQRSVNNCRGLLESGEYDTAIGLLMELREQQPKDISVLRMLGHALMMLDYRDDAMRHLTFAGKLEPNNVDLLIDLCTSYRRIDQVGKAHQAIDRALKINPGYPRSVMAKARLLQSHGKSEEAYQLVKSALEKTHQADVVAVFGQLCRELKRQDEAIDKLREALTGSSLTRANRQDLLFSLGHLLDSVGEYDDAFDCFAKGNAMSAEYPQFEYERWVSNWSKEDYDQIPVSDQDGSRCVFIVGMPRSGTTLTEQIIASHPNANGIGECDMVDKFTRNRKAENFDQEYVNKSGAAYLEMLERLFPDKKKHKRICDKMPENYYYLGFISKALPGSRFIHTRRNPIDTCLSIYFQRFGPRIVYATDLNNCADQYLSYLKATEYLKASLGIEMLDVDYEQTTSEPEFSIRRMLDHVGLPFDEACMNFHKSKKAVHTASVSQIRQPLYKSSTDRWKKYEKHIAPLIDKLGHLIET